MRQLKDSPDGKIEVSWLQPTGIPIESRGANYAAILTDLQPGQPWTVRIMPLQATGEAGDRLFAVDFSTELKPSLVSRAFKHSPISWLMGVLATLLVWQGLRRWRPSQPS